MSARPRRIDARLTESLISYSEGTRNGIRELSETCGFPSSVPAGGRSGASRQAADARNAAAQLTKTFLVARSVYRVTRCPLSVGRTIVEGGRGGRNCDTFRDTRQLGRRIKPDQERARDA